MIDDGEESDETLRMRRRRAESYRDSGARAGIAVTLGAVLPLAFWVVDTGRDGLTRLAKLEERTEGLSTGRTIVMAAETRERFQAVEARISAEERRSEIIDQRVVDGISRLEERLGVISDRIARLESKHASRKPDAEPMKAPIAAEEPEVGRGG